MTIPRVWNETLEKFSFFVPTVSRSRLWTPWSSRFWVSLLYPGILMPRLMPRPKPSQTVASQRQFSCAGTVSDGFGQILLGRFRTVWDGLGQFGMVWDRYFWTAWDSLGQISWTVWDTQIICPKPSQCNVPAHENWRWDGMVWDVTHPPFYKTFS